MTTFTYEVGDLVKVKDPLNRETQRTLDAAGRLRNITNPLGQQTLYTPDALDRITQLTDAINGATAFTYDDNSNLLTVTDAKTQQTVYTYSKRDQKRSGMYFRTTTPPVAPGRPSWCPVRLSGREFWFDAPPVFTLNLNLDLSLGRCWTTIQPTF
ncbi:MAG TPA: hypothetical protein VGQ08_12130 [Nitrospiraceae bacterium]|nr:hypothetical protein [Nitrospiraceae bacterium]